MPGAPGPSVVLGAAGGTGSAVVRELVAREVSVRAVTRSGGADAAERRRAGGSGRRHSGGGAAGVCRCRRRLPLRPARLHEMGGAVPSADRDRPGWSGGGRRQARLRRQPLHVRAAQRFDDRADAPARPGPKGRTRIEMAATILRAHVDGKLRCTIGRSSDYFGPRGTGTIAGDNIMKPALRRQTRPLARLPRPTAHAQLPRRHGASSVTLGDATRPTAKCGTCPLPSRSPAGSSSRSSMRPPDTRRSPASPPAQ